MTPMKQKHITSDIEYLPNAEKKKCFRKDSFNRDPKPYRIGRVPVCVQMRCCITLSFFFIRQDGDLHLPSLSPACFFAPVKRSHYAGTMLVAFSLASRALCIVRWIDFFPMQRAITDTCDMDFREVKLFTPITYTSYVSWNCFINNENSIVLIKMKVRRKR